ncbi:MAG: MarR family transcriptional regulator [Solobacterium sp.]|nr:MarR family transcriptional regulator [Solobacterium sp.]
MVKRSKQQIEDMRALGAGIGRLERHRRRYMNEHLAPYGLIGHQFYFLISLWHEPGLSQENLVEILNIDKTRIARSALQLEEQGYIIRERNPKNRRKYRLYLTPEGEALIPKIRKTVSEWGYEVTQGLSDEDVHTILNYLDVMKSNLK